MAAAPAASLLPAAPTRVGRRGGRRSKTAGDTELGLQTHSFILSVKIVFDFSHLKALKLTA